jgi:hypothetical protein
MKLMDFNVFNCLKSILWVSLKLLNKKIVKSKFLF